MKTNNVAVIDPAEPRVTVVNVYEVEPDKQDALVTLLGKATDEVIKRLPGFISVSVHRSLDGTRVVNYAQWASKADVEAMLKSEEGQARLRDLAALAKSVSPALYEVSSVHVV